MVPLDKVLQWRNVKQRAIQADLTIFTHIPAYSGIIRTLFNSGVF